MHHIVDLSRGATTSLYLVLWLAAVSCGGDATRQAGSEPQGESPASFGPVTDSPIVAPESDSAKAPPMPDGADVPESAGGNAWDGPGPWIVQERFRIGAEDGPPQVLFSGPLTRVAMDPVNRIVVMDPQASVLRLFDADGRFVRTLGGPGEGPGELMNPTAVAWDRTGRLWIANAFNGRYTVFDSAGKFIKTVPRPIRGTSVRHEILFDNTDSFIESAVFDGKIGFLRVDTTGAIIDTLGMFATPQHRFPNAPLPSGVDRAALAYLPALSWALTHEGTVWLADPLQYRLVHMKLGGDTIAVVDLPHRSMRLDRLKRAQIERDLSELGAIGTQDLVQPVVRSMNVLPNGGVLIQIVEVHNRDSDLFDVVGPEGAYLGTVRFGFTMNSRGVPVLRGGRIVTMTLGEYDVPYAVVADVIRRRP